MAEVLKTESVVLSTMTLEAAREALRSESFDLAVVQLDLSRISDAEILPVLKDASGNELPVVVFSPKAENSEVAARIRAVLDKSRGSFDELVEVVKESVNGEADCNVQERQS
jgi:DNA-binding NarL/FixJ family response regulator